MNAPATSIPATFGTAMEGGFYTGRVRLPDGEYAIIAAPRAEGDHDDIKWGPVKRLAGALSFFDGLANTKAMAEAGSKAAKWALELSIGGFDDWYIPSRDELEICYRNLKPTTEDNWCYRGDNLSSVPVGYAYMPDAPAQTEVAAFRKGGAEAFDDTWYWTSTQYAGGSYFAWCQGFSYGRQFGLHKGNAFRVRAVRRVKV